MLLILEDFRIFFATNIELTFSFIVILKNISYLYPRNNTFANSIFYIMNDKTLAFEYFVYKLYEWYKSTKENVDDNDFSTLKVLKLLFFCSAIEADESSEETLLDTTFNNFYAMPYGHVESDIYNSIRKKELQYFSIDNTKTTLSGNPDFSSLSENIKGKIDSSFERLLKENNKLFDMNPIELVELSHLWYSWRYYYSKAQQIGSFSVQIPNNIIKSEEKILFIN